MRSSLLLLPLLLSLLQPVRCARSSVEALAQDSLAAGEKEEQQGGDDDGFGLSAMDKMVGVLRSCSVQGSRPTLERLVHVDCAMHDICPLGSWSGWGACSRSCGGVGLKTRTRTIAGCRKVLRDASQCDAPPCAAPIDCMRAWGAWGACLDAVGGEVSCGGGMHARRDDRVAARARHGGRSCPPAAREARPCNTRPCEQGCVLGAWVPWGPCSACGAQKGGISMRTRRIVTAPSTGGKPCGKVFESRKCHAACPTPAPTLEPNCVMSPWSAWGPCNKSCRRDDVHMVEDDRPFRTRTRKVGQWGKRFKCPGAQLERRTCGAVNSMKCPFDCRMSRWGAWSKCTASCGVGYKMRVRHKLHGAQNGGRTCPVETRKYAKCRTGVICPIDCVRGPWGSWSVCSKTCGLGMRQRTRSVLTDAAFGGRECRHRVQTTSAYCAQNPCAVETHVLPKGNFVPCKLTRWSGWGACSATCGGGKHLRTRAILNMAACTCTVALGNTGWRRLGAGPPPCPKLQQTGSCRAAPCPRSCVLSRWGKWGPCDGRRTKHRNRSMQQMPSNGGVCPALSNKAACTQQDLAAATAAAGRKRAAAAVAAARKAAAEAQAKFNATPVGEKRADEIVRLQEEDDAVTAAKAAAAGAKRVYAMTEAKTEAAAASGRQGSESQPAFDADEAASTATLQHEASDIRDAKRVVAAAEAVFATSAAAHKDAAAIMVREKRKAERAAVREHLRERAERMYAAVVASAQQKAAAAEQWAFQQAGKDAADSAAAAKANDAATVARWKSRSDNHAAKVAAGAAIAASRAGRDGAAAKAQKALLEAKTSSNAADDAEEFARAKASVLRAENVKAAAAEAANAAAKKVLRELPTFGEWRQERPGAQAVAGGQVRSQRQQQHQRPASRAPAAASPGLLPPASPPLWSDRTSGHAPTPWPTMAPTRTPTPFLTTHVPTLAPADCSVSSWGRWSACSDQCEGGLKVRQRHSLVAAQNGGRACPAMSESHDCNQHAPCAVHCVFVRKTWSPCTRSCGTGTQLRHVYVNMAAAHGGKPCPATVQRTCNMHACPTPAPTPVPTPRPTTPPTAARQQEQQGQQRQVRPPPRQPQRHPVRGGSSAGGASVAPSPAALACAAAAAVGMLGALAGRARRGKPESAAPVRGGSGFGDRSERAGGAVSGEAAHVLDIQLKTTQQLTYSAMGSIPSHEPDGAVSDTDSDCV